MLLEHAIQFEITIAQTVSDLERLVPEWHRLWQNDPRATPFQSPAWLIPWARHFTAGELCCVSVRAGEQLIAFIPTFTWRNPETCGRELLLLGTGISDYCDALALSECGTEPFTAAFTCLRNTVQWDVLNYQELRPDSPLRGDSSVDHQSVIPVLELTRAGEETGTAIPKAQLHNLAYYRRRAERIGNCRWELAHGDSLDSILQEFFELHTTRWRERDEVGVLQPERVREFHRDAARGLLRIGALRLYRLSIRGERAAALYGFASHGRTYYYLSGFNPKFASVSPGTLIIGHAIEQAMREGCTHFDFLRGAERYKYLWGAKDAQTFRRVEKRESNDAN